jgi:hypothetical protein
MMAPVGKQADLAAFHEGKYPSSISPQNRQALRKDELTRRVYDSFMKFRTAAVR